MVVTLLLAMLLGQAPTVNGSAAGPSAATSQPQPVEVRVGIVAFEDFHADRERFERLFAGLSQRDPGLRFRIAVGTYGDVLHWIKRQQVDLAVLTPGTFAELSAGIEPDSQSPAPIPPSFQYLATTVLPPATSSWAQDDRREDRLYDWYRPACLVAETSRLKSARDLQQAARDGSIEFLFVHPLSASGRRAAEFALRKIGIDPPRNRVRYTYSHSASIRLLQESHPNHPRVAFVWDDAAAGDPELTRAVRRLPFPALDELRIPHDVIVAAAGFRHADRIRDVLLGARDSAEGQQFTRLDDWRERYGVIGRWWSETGFASADGPGQTVSLDEIGQMLLHYARSQPAPPRLAVVLSGGGAKCSYQVGAVGALEEKLAELREQNPDSGLDIALVVGTSGGAINSLPIAMGITRTPKGRKDFADTWTELDQREIVRPSLLVRGNIGLWFALFQTACVYWIVRRLVKNPETRGRAFAILFTSLAAVEILIGYVPASPWQWLGMNHWAHHAWLWIGFGVRASAWSLLVLGALALLLEAVRARRGRHIAIPGWLTWTTLSIGLFGLPLLQVITVATVEKTLSGGQGMEHAVAEKFPRLIDNHLERLGLSPLEADAAVGANQPGILARVGLQGSAVADARRLEAVSRQIVERGLLERDLVLTGSCLSQTSETLPSDLYFYMAGPACIHAGLNEDAGAANVQSGDNRCDEPPFGERGISLVDRPAILLDVVLGSGSIFPVFPPRRVTGVPRPEDRIELVDGGFAHNSPIEAAVLWGATHVVLIEATPRKRPERTNFLHNASASFSHLYQQAQLLDARSREQVVIFSLSPQPPHMCVLDFADNLIADSIRRGREEAGMTHADGKPRFRKEPGLPVFVEVGGEGRESDEG